MSIATVTPTAPHARPRNLRRATYEALLEDFGDRADRLDYDRGDLEIMTPSHRHEQWRDDSRRMIEHPCESARSTPIGPASDRALATAERVRATRFDAAAGRFPRPAEREGRPLAPSATIRADRRSASPR